MNNMFMVIYKDNKKILTNKENTFELCLSNRVVDEEGNIIIPIKVFTEDLVINNNRAYLSFNAGWQRDSLYCIFKVYDGSKNNTAFYSDWFYDSNIYKSDKYWYTGLSKFMYRFLKKYKKGE